MIPLALAFTSTFDSGSILPRATTDRATSPFSTTTIFSVGIGLALPTKAISPSTPAMRMTPTMPATSTPGRAFVFIVSEPTA